MSSPTYTPPSAYVALLCVSLSFSELKACHFSSGEIVPPLSDDCGKVYVFPVIFRIKGVWNGKALHHPVTRTSHRKAPNEPSANGQIFFFSPPLLSVPIEL